MNHHITDRPNALVPTQDPERYRALVKDLFNPQWLTCGGSHRVQQLWTRRDDLAKLELASLGFAIDALAPHRQWLTNAIRAAKKQPAGSHGHLFEIMLLGSLAAGGMQLMPKRANAPGYDAEIVLDNGHVLRASIKNHDLSTHEAAFRDSCEKLNSMVKARVGQSGGSWSVRAYSPGHMDKATMQSLTEKMRVVPLIGVEGTNQVGPASLVVSPLAWPDVLPGSHQLVVYSPAYELEQPNFQRKLARAIDDFARHSPRGEPYSNVIFMRVHATADVAALQELAKLQLAEPGCVVDAVYFLQSAVTREAAGWVISTYISSAATTRYERCGAKLTLQMLAGRSIERPTRLQVQSSTGAMADVSGQYLFQRGDLYYPLVIDQELALPSRGAGLRSIGVYEDHEGNRMNVGIRTPGDDELLIV